MDEQGSVTTSATDNARRHALGGALKVWRTHKGLSKVHAAELLGIAPLTWSRLESGWAVRNNSYAAVDTVLHEPVGTTLRALADDDALVALAGRLGVDTSAVPDSMSATGWVLKTALLSDRRAEVGVPTVATAADPVLGAATTVITFLAGMQDRSARQDRALRALLAAVPELTAS